MHLLRDASGSTRECPGVLQWARVFPNQPSVPRELEPKKVYKGEVRRECPVCGHRDFWNNQNWVVVALNHHHPGILSPWLGRSDHWT